MRKTLLSLAAAAALGIGALAPTAASAWHPHWPHRPHFGPIFFAPVPVAPALAYDGCIYRKRVVLTPWGPRVRLVPVCY